MKKGTILDLCANVAIEGRAFALFDSPSLKKILEFSVLGAQEPKQSFSAAKVKEAVKDRAKNLREKIKEQLRNQAVSISADFASLHGSQFLGMFSFVKYMQKSNVIRLF